VRISFDLITVHVHDEEVRNLHNSFQNVTPGRGMLSLNTGAHCRKEKRQSLSPAAHR
jgi:hypothetical protein